MPISNTLQVLCVLGPLAGSIPASAEVPANFRTEELVAWCIVPFDAKKRGPAARTEMLAEIGLKRCAYDWRAEHVPTFEEEILHYKKHGVEYFAFWGEHEAAFSLFKKHGLTPQIWNTLPSPKTGTQEEQVAAAVTAMTPLAIKTARMGCQLGLYNHGGWGGEPGEPGGGVQSASRAGPPARRNRLQLPSRPRTHRGLCPSPRTDETSSAVPEPERDGRSPNREGTSK